MPVGGLSEADVEGWRAILDDNERQRTARFVFERNRVEYIAAHALARLLLSSVTGELPEAIRFRIGVNGKPELQYGGRASSAVRFNLSHTNGMVVVGAADGLELGVDVEATNRRVDLAVADRYFFGAEARWLAGLDPSRRTEGFLRLWTLKEAYIKATGLGLSQPLDEFWFEVDPARIRFTPAIADDESAWRFRQRLLAGRFLLAAGWRLGAGREPVVTIETLSPAELRF